MADFRLTYQIILIELMERSVVPLSTARILDFTAQLPFFDYFQTQETLNSLLEAGMVETENSGNTTLYHSTVKAHEAYELYHSEVPPDIRDQIIEYLNDNELSIQTDNALSCVYHPSYNGGYLCTLRRIENDRIQISLSVHVANVDAAKAVCANWKARYEDVYAAIMDQLIK